MNKKYLKWGVIGALVLIGGYVIYEAGLGIQQGVTQSTTTVLGTLGVIGGIAAVIFLLPIGL